MDDTQGPPFQSLHIALFWDFDDAHMMTMLKRGRRTRIFLGFLISFCVLGICTTGL